MALGRLSFGLIVSWESGGGEKRLPLGPAALLNQTIHREVGGVRTVEQDEAL